VIYPADLAKGGGVTLIYKLLSQAEWAHALALGRFDGSEVDLADGFIHFSAAPQAQETAAKWFAGRSDLMLLGVEAESLGEALKWEPRAAANCFRTSIALAGRR
jgi:uncharacterized protein (DUF952 family)